MRYGGDQRRRSTRLPTWDYRDSGAYFVTICTHDRMLLFGRFARDDLVLNQFGKVADEVWRKTIGGGHGEFVVMPNHVHGIIWVRRDPVVPAQLFRMRQGLRDGLDPGSLFVIVRTFKSAVAKRINTMRGSRGARVWQRDYRDRIIRDEHELQAARAYILDNPRKWALDKHNPAVFSKRPATPPGRNPERPPGSPRGG